MTVIEPPVEIRPHSLLEDALAIPTGAFLLSWGMYLLHAINHRPGRYFG